MLANSVVVQAMAYRWTFLQAESPGSGMNMAKSPGISDISVPRQFSPILLPLRTRSYFYLKI